MTVQKKIARLREIMEREGLDAYIVSGTDPHNSEYLPEAWQQREWISGFTGSFGTVVVTKEDAGLWTDSRYFIQAKEQLAGTGVCLHKLRIPGAIDYPEWLSEKLQSGCRVGMDSFCMSVQEVDHLKKVLSVKNIELVGKADLLGEIWLDRPALPASSVCLLEEKYAGESALSKIAVIQDKLKECQADYFLFSCLDEIAWLFNIRCHDIAYNPVAISYAVVGKEKSCFFIKPSKLSAEVVCALEGNRIEIRDYHHLFLFFDELGKDVHFLADLHTLNYAIYNRLVSSFKVTDTISPVILNKAVKNRVEIEGFRKACIKDGVAMTRFFLWLEQELGFRPISETEAAEKLSELRAACPDYVSDSFHTISAYGKNAALPHYSAIPGKDAVLKKKGLYLVDSGGQYVYGTTDITRTIPLGELTQQEKEDYTLVLKGMIALSRCVFPKGTTGANIDVVARQPLWNNKMNYGHGTGHGVGHFLCVHEGPQDIRQAWRAQAILPGMVTSDEPGMYRENSHGIRHENLIVCQELGENEFGEWCGFETITLCYFDTSALLIELLSEDDKKWLNVYHSQVFEKIAPYLTESEKVWLQKKTEKI